MPQSFRITRITYPHFSRGWLILFLLSYQWIQPLLAQNNTSNSNANTTVLQLSLNESIRYALEHQRNLRVSALDEKIAQQKVYEILAVGFPQLNGSFEFQNFVQLPTSIIPANSFGNPEPMAVRFGTKFNSTAGLQLNQLIFDGTYFIGLKAAREYVKLARVNTQRTKIETITNVSKAYYSALVNEQRLSLLESNITQLKKLLDDTKAMNSNGLVESIDVDRVQVAYNNLLTELDKAKRMVELSYYFLKFQMGLDVNAPVKLTDTISMNDFNPTLADTTSPFNKESRIEYKLLEQSLRLQDLNIQRVKAQFYPSLVGFGTLQSQALRQEFNVFDTSKPWFAIGIIGLRVNVPIFGGFKNHAVLQQAKLERQKIATDMENLDLVLGFEYQQARALMINSLKTLEVQRRNMDLAKEVYRVTTVKYQEGVGTNYEVVDAENLLKQSQLNYVNALLEAYIARVDLQKALGNVDDEPNNLTPTR